MKTTPGMIFSAMMGMFRALTRMIPALAFPALCCLPAHAHPPQKIWLAREQRALLPVLLPAGAPVAQQFAASELAAYLERISGAAFPLLHAPGEHKGLIRLEIDPHSEKEEYDIRVQGRDIVLSGGSDRAILYAVYEFLRQLGCLWLAPDLSFYNGKAGHIPHAPELYYENHGPVHKKPRLAYRKLDVEEGRSFNTENLKQLIDWMPKLGFNILMVPLDYGGWGKVQWDRWREALTPELRKRDLLIEVGGHGYQNFLNAAMEDSTLFKKHPDWFGKNKDCVPTPDPYSVFNTENPDAVEYFIHRVEDYIRQHPEIDIFDCWPPDGARWADCKDWLAMGSPLDRQARLLNQVDAALKAIRPGIRLEMIAYQPVIDPPPTVALNQDILVDFCPINQQFEQQIFDPSASNNLAYTRALRQWREKFPGDIGLYSYYRKYAWRSLPNIIPHYMQRDLQWYAQVPVQGISTYAEPGDWMTYELNHYVLAHLAWDPEAAVDTLINRFCRARYGPFWETARAVYEVLENTVRFTGNIPYTPLKSAAAIERAEKALTDCLDTLSAASGRGADFSKLSLMVRYALYDLQIQETRKSDPALAAERVKAMVEFLEANRDQGLFILPAGSVLQSFLKRYGLHA